jgi:hypothetical protein
MVPGKERKADELDFRGQIKKVRVVAWLDEKEAGGRAVSREKELLGLAHEEKLPGPFKVILFQRNLWKTKTCILCDFSSFEAKRKEQDSVQFLRASIEHYLLFRFFRLYLCHLLFSFVLVGGSA